MNEKTTVTTDNDDIEVSTVKLPVAHGPDRNQQYETCLFWDGGSRVKERYETESEAKDGHEKYVDALEEGRFSRVESQVGDIQVTTDE